MKRLVMTAVIALLSTDAVRADLYLKIDGIPGSSGAIGRNQWLDIHGFGIGVFTPPDPTPDNPLDMLPSPRPTAMRVEGSLSPSSPHLFFGAASAQVYDLVRLDIEILHQLRPRVVAYWELENARISSYETVAEEPDAPAPPIVNEQYDITPLGYVRYGFNSFGGAGDIIGTTEVEWDLIKGRVALTTTGDVSGFQFLNGDVDVSDLIPAAPDGPGGSFSADFDNDGDVDGEDLAEWTGDFGANGFSDADDDGDSDGADFLAWQQQLGSGAPAAGSAAPAPEPATMSLSMLAAVVLLWRGRRSWSPHSMNPCGCR